MSEPANSDPNPPDQPETPGEKLVLNDDGHIREEVARRAVKFVATYRRSYRRGPTWRELGDHMGWTRKQLEPAIIILRRAEILYTTGRYRSLQLHPRLRPPRRPRGSRPASRTTAVSEPADPGAAL
ncbi:hypothetical protein [Isoptericola aurantiacus]|uniref:hypothetical protein n=1 Tax=Isoptericola aurantiacus TaxID=3377839 RepID=UPI00383A0152